MYLRRDLGKKKEFKHDYTQCMDRATRFFIQYQCKQSKEEIHLKNEKAEQCIYIAIGCAIFIFLFAEYGKFLTQKVAVNHDIRTVTPSDYVLYMYLTEKQMNDFDFFYRA